MLIARDGTILSSDDERKIGQIVYQYTDEAFLDEILYGNTVLRLPEHRSAAFFPHEEAAMHQDAIMLAGSRVSRDNGEVLGALILLIDAGREFSEIFERARLGSSGEIYGFNHHGYMISHSRFEDELREAGMLGPDESSIMTIRLTEPGVDVIAEGAPEFTDGERPLTHVAAEALAGRSGLSVEGYRNYRGVDVIGAWIWDPKILDRVNAVIPQLRYWT